MDNLPPTTEKLPSHPLSKWFFTPFVEMEKRLNELSDDELETLLLDMNSLGTITSNITSEEAEEKVAQLGFDNIVEFITAVSDKLPTIVRKIIERLGNEKENEILDNVKR